MIRSALTVAIVAGAIHCGGRVEPSPAAATGTVTVESATVGASDGQWFSMRLHVANGTAHPAYVYAESLGTRFDDAAAALTLTMHEVPSPPTGSSADCHVHIPALLTVPALTSVDLDVRLPVVQSEFTSASKIVKHVLTSAKRVDVELGWSDRPMQLTPAQKSLCVFDAATALQAIERGVAKGSFAL